MLVATIGQIHSECNKSEQSDSWEILEQISICEILLKI